MKFFNIFAKQISSFLLEVCYTYLCIYESLFIPVKVKRILNQPRCKGILNVFEH